MRKSRLLSTLLAMGLVFSLFVSASAFHDLPDATGDGEGDVINPWAASPAHSYFPWVPNGNEIDGMGEYTGDITLMNLEQTEAEIDIFVGNGADGGWGDPVEAVTLAPNESITLSADLLGVPAGSGASVVAAGWLERGQDAIDETMTCQEILDDDDLDIEDFNACELDDEGELENPDEEVEVVVEGIAAEYARISGVLKSVSPNGSTVTTANDVSVDGYSGLTGLHVSQEIQEDWYEIDVDGTYVLPIAQRNDGWETILRVANLSDEGGLTNITLTFYGSGEQGFAGESAVVNLQLRAGDVQSVDVADYLPEEWVGSVFITSGADVGVVAERYKVNDQMLITNTSSPEPFAAFFDGSPVDKFGALVFQEYNHWNTGISVANVSPDSHNSVTITYYGPTMNQVGQDTLTIPPRGMEFVYNPGSQDLGLPDGFVGSVRITGTQPLHAAIDQVKYFGNDPDVGQAMSYIADGETAWSFGDMLSMPLMQKGNPVTGSGDTSGIQLFNASTQFATGAELVFYGANGIPVAPTVEDNDADPIQLSLGPNQSYTVYSHEQSELSSGFRGSAVVTKTWGDGELVGVSNNVNYDVQADGSVAFPMVLSWGGEDS